MSQPLDCFSLLAKKISHHSGDKRDTGLKVGLGRQGRRPGTPLICQVYNGSLVYSLVVLNRIKYHQ